MKTSEKEQQLINAMPRTCSKCGGKVKLEKVQDTCHCGADIHLKQTCLDCGFVSYVHRFDMPNEDMARKMAQLFIDDVEQGVGG
jgi:hypothetical protein